MEKCQPATSEAYNFGANLGELDIVDQFLSADNSVASLQSKEGMTAVHLATKGHTAVLLAMVATCQDIWDLQDNRGQTALHVAVENQKINVAKVFLDLVSEDLLYQQDNEGNIYTPLTSAIERLIRSSMKNEYAWMTLHIVNSGGLASTEGVLKRCGCGDSEQKKASFKAFVTTNILAFCLSSVPLYLHCFTSLVGSMGSLHSQQISQ
ncbi:ankyrin repeat-containing protein At5g02620-like [Ricinus communis]|uniref:ankyrin repeat-containing protein At5g02620-like n=1 Tax=Ricinus communis TaxID=3988 RepID=UPI00201A7B94|nr:ankyrin repeat-containing protein At5g02620-like [Ricinus communis]